MQKIRCPHCDEPILFDEKHEAWEGHVLIFECPACHKQFRLARGAQLVSAEQRPGQDTDLGAAKLLVMENAFHFRQAIPLHMGRNTIGRWVRGTSATSPIKTVDPSMDTLHCILTASRTKKGGTRFELADGPSSTGTFLMNNLLGRGERAALTEGDVITLGATTMIFTLSEEDD